MNKVLRGSKEVLLNLTELGIFYFATIEHFKWAMNIMYFIICFSFAATVLGLIGLSSKPELAKGAKKRVIPRTISTLIDITCITLLVIQGWWFWVVLHTIGVLCQQAFYAKWEELRKQYETSEPQIVKEESGSKSYSRLIRPEVRQKGLFRWLH